MDRRNFATIWEGMADSFGDRVVITQGDQRLTWREWDDEASRLAGWLEAQGVGEGDRVGVVAYNVPEVFVIMLAGFKLRAVATAFNYRYLAPELIEVLTDCGAPVVFFHGSLGPELDLAREQLPGVQHWVELDDGDPPSPWAVPYASTLDSPPAARRERSAEDHTIQYTGGTTGRPKGVVWTHRQIIDTVSIMSYLPLGIGMPDTVEEMVDIARRQVEAGAAPVYLVSAPLMHGSGLWSCFAQLQVGGQLILLESRSMDPAEILTAIQQHHVRSIVVIGDAFARPLVEELERAADAGQPYDLSSIEGISSSGVAFSAPYKRRFLAHATKAVLLEAVGGSEGGPIGTSITWPGTEPTDTAVFTASDNTVLIDEGHVVPWGTEGTFLFGYKGPLPSGYLDDPDKTAATFPTIDGVRYLVSGDMGSIDADGTLRFIGRGNTCINTGGEKVFPAEVEEVVKVHPDVVDCLVVGVPNERFGSAVAALVSLRDGASLDLDGLVAHCKTHLSGYKQPRHLVLVDAVRRSVAGKADYRWATELAMDQLADR